ncbi:glycoside hydrolase 5 family protein [Sulfobacillus harzensis]|uniref:Cellulase family glycosylhydrolase n=1 Tax=Sulfobacillus harzensis TaxID=2729629 RepID=A0A7Y0L5K9_9FIRM|nr:cellulase family glycosylhydrolase [Sulfobacillus harzensis]NMP22890.1 cellulase family glycosylhydrolase [Sulfobacillus harzensis]
MTGFSLGANYWSRVGGPRMWSQWDAAAVRQELGWARDIGLDTLRFFIYWPDFEPQPGVDNPALWERVAEFLNLCQEYGLKTFPTLLVGHMSGRNWDPAWREGRDLWTDAWMVEHEEAFIRRSVSRLQSMPTVSGWVLTNEWPLYAGLTTPEVFEPWIQRMTHAVREHDPKRRPITMGDGLWNAMGANNGIQVDMLEQYVDIVGPHVYPETPDAAEVAMASYVHCAMGQGKRPVLLEEFGTTDAFGTGEQQGAFYRSQLAGALMAGAVGAWGWCLTDFELPTTMPYSHHPFELRFGLLKTDGTPKPTAKAMKSFGEAARQFGQVDPDRIGVLVPALQTEVIPFRRGPEGELMTRVASRMLRSLAQLGYNPLVIREPIPPASGFVQDVPELPELDGCDTLFLVAPRIGEPLRLRLEDWVRQGGRLYLAYSYTYWFPDTAAFLGVERTGQYNVKERFSGPAKMIGRIGADLEIFGEADFVSLKGVAAEVLAQLDTGEAVLFRHNLGRGAVVVNALGLEASAGEVDGLVRFYQSLLGYLQVSPRVQLSGSVGQAAVSTTGQMMVMNHGGTVLKASAASGMLDGQKQIEVPPHQWWVGTWSK